MSVYLPKGATTYYYDFVWRGHRYRDTTHQTRRADAELVEAQLKLRLRQQAGGIAPFDPRDTPRFQDWANVYLQYQRAYTTRPDVIGRTLAIVLEFFGTKPRRPRKAPAVKRGRTVAPPYHDLCLGHPIADPTWVRRFDEWIAARGVSASTRNTYLSCLSGLYRVALQPEYRPDTGISTNPFRDVRRRQGGTREVALDAETIVRWVQEAGYHVGLACTIAALAPKLRLGSILALRWDEHFDADLRVITVTKHKTASRTGRSQVTPISDDLREVLLDARARQAAERHAAIAKGRTVGDYTHVVTWRGRAVKDVKTAAKRATTAAGLTWGVKAGVTFHTIRHSIATLLATMGLSERIRMELMGHAEIRTTQKYTHLTSQTQVAPHAQLAAQVPVAAAVMSKRRPGQVVKLASRRRSA